MLRLTRLQQIFREQLVNMHQGWGASLRVDTSIPRWHSTGLYAAPGEKVIVTVPTDVARKGLMLRIGAHKDGIWRRNAWRRFPEITRIFRVNLASTVGACAFGGLVYIDVPRDCSLGMIDVEIDGAARSPFYVHGKTDLAEWRNRIRSAPEPWAEIGSNSESLLPLHPGDVLPRRQRAWGCEA